MLSRIRKAMEEKEEGFTLIELLVVIIIIGILAAIAIPVFLSQRQKGYDAAVKSDLRNTATAEESFLTNSTTSYATGSQLSSANLLAAISPNDTVTIYTISGQGYCLIGSNLNHPNTYFVYDSLAGGLQSTVYTTSAVADCPTTSAGTWTAAGGLNQTGSVFSAS